MLERVHLPAVADRVVPASIRDSVGIPVWQALQALAFDGREFSPEDTVGDLAVALDCCEAVRFLLQIALGGFPVPAVAVSQSKNCYCF